MSEYDRFILHIYYAVIKVENLLHFNLLCKITDTLQNQIVVMQIYH